MKKLFTLLICSIVLNFNVVANEMIKLELRGFFMGNRLKIAATANKQFTIDWGDDSSIETITGTGSSQILHHSYAENDNWSNYYEVIIASNSADCFFILFDCSWNDVTTLDVSASISLERLNCSQNKLINLDVDANTALTELICDGNSLSTLDVDKFAVLTRLSFNNNHLKNINVSANPLLTCLSFELNQINSLDVSANPLLTSLDCYGNELSNLDIRANTLLEALYCGRNQLTDLDVSKNTKLNALSCRDNKLTDLDVSENTKLNSLSCGGNKLTDLDLTNNKKVVTLWCSHNQLLLSKLYEISQIVYPEYDTDLLLGSQTLDPQAIEVGGVIDFSSQAAFGGIATIFTIEKGDSPAVIDIDYSINGGVITFIRNGIYKVIMTNQVLPSFSYFPTQVIAEFIVGTVGMTDVTQTNGLIYPNPTNGMIYIKTEKEIIPEVKLYSTDGKLLQHVRNVEIDMSNYATGVYVIQVDGKNMRLIKF